MKKNKQLTREEFETLIKILDKEPLDQANNLVVESLAKEGFLNGYEITKKGFRALEPYKVKRAIIIAAGFGSRLVPITLNTPKPLVRVHGKRIIDTLLDAIESAGIEEVYIVRGYLKEQFDQLLYKYPNIKFIDNLQYNEANNISSILKVDDLVQNAYVMEADLLLKNPKLVRRYEYQSNFLGFPVSASDDWCFTVKDGIISEQIVGLDSEKVMNGMKTYQEIGISHWTSEDGKKIERHAKEAFKQENGKQLYWDQIMFKVFPNEYSVEIRPCKKTDVLEIDTFKELQAEDEAYQL